MSRRIISESQSGVPLEDSISNAASFTFSQVFDGEEMIPVSEARKMVSESVNAVMSVFDKDSPSLAMARKAWIEGKTCSQIASEMSTSHHSYSVEAVTKQLQRLSQRFPYREFLPH